MTSPDSRRQRRVAFLLAAGLLGGFTLVAVGLAFFLGLSAPVRSPEREVRKAAEAFSPPSPPAWRASEERSLPTGGRLLIGGNQLGETVLLVGEVGTGAWLWSYLAPSLGEARPVAVVEWPVPLDSPQDLIATVREALAALRARGARPAVIGLGAGASAAAAAIARPAPREPPLLARACAELLAAPTPGRGGQAPGLLALCAELLATLEPGAVESPVSALVLIAPLGPRHWTGLQVVLGRVFSGSAERAAVSPGAAPAAWRLYQQNALRAGVVAPAVADLFSETAQAAPPAFTSGFVERFWQAPYREWASAPLTRLPLAPLLVELTYDQFVPPADLERVALLLAESGVGIAGRASLDSGHLAPIDWRWRELLALLEEHLGAAGG